MCIKGDMKTTQVELAYGTTLSFPVIFYNFHVKLSMYMKKLHEYMRFLKAKERSSYNSGVHA